MKEVWVFNGSNSRFASGIFTEKEIAETWIKRNKLTGILTLYPLDKGVYEWAVENSLFIPEKEAQKSTEFIQQFSSASQEHYHYENGSLEG